MEATSGPVGGAGAGMGGGVRGSQKGLPDGTVNGKRIKMIQNNVVMVGLTISMHFQQFEELNFIYFFPREHALRPFKTLAESPTVPIWEGLSGFYSRVPNPNSTSDSTRVSRF